MLKPRASGAEGASNTTAGGACLGREREREILQETFRISVEGCGWDISSSSSSPPATSQSSWKVWEKTIKLHTAGGRSDP